MRVECFNEEKGAVCRLRFRPEDDGSATLDGATLTRLKTLLQRVHEDETCRVLVLEGEPGSFCRGMDLEKAMELSAERAIRQMQRYTACLERLRTLRQLVVAAVDGPANGGGVGLAAASDLLLASAARATFGLPELALGILPAMVLPVLLERMPLQKARLLALSETVDAERAEALGLVDQVVRAPETLDHAVTAVVRRALRFRPESVRALKRLCDELAGLPRGEALALTAWRSAELVTDETIHDAIAGFLDGEPLPWFARYRGRRRAARSCP